MGIPRQNTNNAKGALYEELIGNYFREAGYFVVRSVPVDFAQISVTDIDVWLYMRPSSAFREISIVDIKNRRTPQAMERIFWTKGLQVALTADRAMVATTDSRKEVRSFGRELDVTIIDGQFLKRLQHSRTLARFSASRLTEDEFLGLISESSLGKIGGDWKLEIIEAKKRLAHNISFNSIAYWLEQAKLFADGALARPAVEMVAFRCLARILSFILIGIDYLLRDVAFLDSESKRKQLLEGLVYGSSGRVGVEARIEEALRLVETFGDLRKPSAQMVRARVSSALQQMPASILADYFSRQEVAKDLFTLSKEFDEASFAVHNESVLSLSSRARAALGVFLDFLGHDRKDFIGMRHPG